MIVRLITGLLVVSMIFGWPVLKRDKFKSSGKRGVKPVVHKGYYKKHIYKNHFWIGSYKTGWFEKQGVRNARVPK